MYTHTHTLVPIYRIEICFIVYFALTEKPQPKHLLTQFIVFCLWSLTEHGQKMKPMPLLWNDLASSLNLWP